MTEGQQLRQVCGWNRRLAGENRSLRAELGRARSKVEGLEVTNAGLRVECEAADVLLGAAIDQTLEAHR